MYETLYREYHDRLFRLARRIVGDTALAQDVVQEVHIKCWKHREKLESLDNPGAWMMRVTRNLSIDKVRSRKQTTELDSVAYSAPSGNATPDHSAEMANMMEILREVVKTLPEKQQSVFQLREIEGLKYKEIGEVMDISVDEVKINLFRARQKIRQSLTRANNYGLSSAHPESH